MDGSASAKVSPPSKEASSSGENVPPLEDDVDRVVDALLAQPEQPIHALPVLPAEELRTVVVDFNRAPNVFPRESVEIYEQIIRDWCRI